MRKADGGEQAILQEVLDLLPDYESQGQKIEEGEPSALVPVDQPGESDSQHTSEETPPRSEAQGTAPVTKKAVPVLKLVVDPAKVFRQVLERPEINDIDVGKEVKSLPPKSTPKKSPEKKFGGFLDGLIKMGVVDAGEAGLLQEASGCV